MNASANQYPAYELARQRYAELGVDTDAALRRLASIPISIHCWQGDDVGGFENTGEEIGGGLAVTGAYPGKARNADELRGDFNQALSLIPGNHRFSLHTIYAETGGTKVERDELAPEHFSRWIDWAKTHELGLDFNPTFFAHPKAAADYTYTYDSLGRVTQVEQDITGLDPTVTLTAQYDAAGRRTQLAAEIGTTDRVLPASVKNSAGASATAWVPVGMTGEGSGRSASGADE